MYCPQCGTENDAANRFCVSCGSDLSKPASRKSEEKVSLRRRLELLIGTSRRARLLTVATVVAILIAIAAFIAIKPEDEGVIQDAYLTQLDRTCVAEKERLATLELETLRREPADFGEFASVLVTIVAEWRSGLQATPPPPIHAEGVGSLEAALLGALIKAGTLARVSRAGASVPTVGAKAQAVDEATRNVDRAIKQLGLERCARVEVAPSA
jgi:hypothetical protein